MGIQGLLPLLREASRNVHLESLKGLTIGIDAYVWLHRAAYGCAADLALGKPTRRYVDYCVDQVKRLQSFGIVPYLVFDGGPLPAKKGTEIERRQKRQEARQKGLDLWHAGQKSEAFDYFAASVDVSPAMAFEVIKVLRRMNVKYVVAPYEADAQLAFLEKTGTIDAIMTEDSDLLVFGCKRVFYKLDKDSVVQEINRARFCDVRAEIVLGGKFTDEKFRWMCILSGCDYLASIPNLGLKKAYNLIVRCSTVAMALRTGSFTYKLTVPKDYLDEFQRAENTFLYQRVFDPVERKLVHLNPLPAGSDLGSAQYLGRHLPDEVAQAIATGDLDPVRRSVLGSVPATVMDMLAALYPAAEPASAEVGKKAGSPVLVLGSDEVDPASLDDAARPIQKEELDPAVQAAALVAMQNRALKQITSQTVVDSRTRSPFFAAKPVPNAVNVAAPSDRPKKVIMLKKLKDENIVSDLPSSARPTRTERELSPAPDPEAEEDESVEREPSSFGASQTPSQNRVENASQLVFQGMLNKYRSTTPRVPIPVPAPRPVPRGGLKLDSFAKSFPAYNFLYQDPARPSSAPQEPEGDSSPQPGWSSQPILPTQSSLAKRKRQSAPLPRPASQPARGKRVSLTNQMQLTSGWFSGWQPSEPAEE